MIKHTDCILVMGQRGCGKSFLAKNIQKVFARKIIIDSLGEYTEGQIVFSFDEFCQAIEKIKSENPSEFQLIYQFDPENRLADVEFEHILRLSYYLGNVQLVIEEIQLYASPHSMPHWLKQCFLIGRHQNLSILVTTQRPGELNKTILSQCTHVFVGKITEPNDLKYLSGFLGEHAERLIGLDFRRFLYFSPSGVTEISNQF